MWFIVIIGGFLVFLEGAITSIAVRFFPKNRQEYVKVMAGVIIIVLGFLGAHFLV